jgi:hypothetical protein
MRKLKFIHNQKLGVSSARQQIAYRTKIIPRRKKCKSFIITFIIRISRFLTLVLAGIFCRPNRSFIDEFDAGAYRFPWDMGHPLLSIANVVPRMREPENLPNVTVCDGM